MSFVPQQLELQIADGGLAGHEPASPDHNPKKHAEACAHASSTPLSQASTAPTTPNMMFRLPSLSLDGFDEEHFPLLTRQLSIPEDEGATFEAPDKLQGVLHDVHQMYLQKYGAASEDDSQDFSYSDDGTYWTSAEGASNTRPHSSQESLENLLTEVKDLYQQKYGFPVDQAQEDLQENATDRDGLVWNVIHGTGAPKDCRVARLEQKLAQVKQLYELKYGADVESDDEDVQFDQDGTPWIETRGTGSPQDMRLERLEQMLADVKGLYAAKYGRDVDIEHDADGTPWTVTEGTGVPRDCRVARLEQKLAQVKQLYELKYGAEIESDDEDVQFDQDGTPWIETRGTGSPRDMRLERLEQMLGDVKGLYAAKYGRDVDIEHDADGTPWTVTEGTGVPRDCRVARLEQKLAQVKQLYELKYGAEIESDDEDVEFDQDGTPWIETRGTGSPRDMRLERLEQMLGDVKGLYAAKYGRDVDIEHDADGTPWIVTEGTGVPCDYRLVRLEQKLAQVKQLYELKYGNHVFAAESGLHNVEGDFMYDADGTLWIRSITTGFCGASAPRAEVVEDMLQEVKALCNSRFGSKPIEEAQSSWSDEDGTPWVQVGSSASQGDSADKAQPFAGTCNLQ